MSSSSPSSSLMYNELRARYEEEWNIKNNLDSKAVSVITISGTLILLIYGFTALSFINLPVLALSFVLCSIVLNLIAILLAVWTFRLQKYSFTLDITRFVDPKSKQRKEADIEEYKVAHDLQLIDGIIDSYIDGIYERSVTNTKKTSTLQYSFYFLIAGICGISVATLLTIIIPFLSSA